MKVMKVRDKVETTSSSCLFRRNGKLNKFKEDNEKAKKGAKATVELLLEWHKVPEDSRHQTWKNRSFYLEKGDTLCADLSEGVLSVSCLKMT